MKFDTVIIGGGLSGLVAGISLQKEGRSTAIISSGQNALHFFSGTFESIKEPSRRVIELFNDAGIKLLCSSGQRLMPLGSFKDAALSLEDVSIFPDASFSKKALVVNFAGYPDFFSSFIAEGLEKKGISCRIEEIAIPGLSRFLDNPDEMRSVQIAKVVDAGTPDVIKAVTSLLKDEDAVILPQVFGLQDSSVPEKIRQAIDARVVFVGTLPPSVPGIRTQNLLKRRFDALGGTFLAGDEVLKARIQDGVIISLNTKNLDSHNIEADTFILATGGYFSKGLSSSPYGISEPVFGLDLDATNDRNDWYDPDFMSDQPYMKFGVKTDSLLHALLEGEPVKNLYAIGSVLGATRPEFGFGAGLAIQSALAATDIILNNQSDAL